MFGRSPPGPLIADPVHGIVNSTMPELFRYHPRLFWTLQPDLDLSLIPWADRTTPDGFRGVEAVAPKGEATRVVCLGDSCTYGFGVPHDAAWPAVLARNAGLDVVNAGVPGYSSHQGVILWDERGSALDADVVTIQFGANDSNSWSNPFVPDDEQGEVGLTDAQRARHLSLHDLFRRSAFLGAALALTAPEPESTSTTSRGLYTGPVRVPLKAFEANVRTLLEMTPQAVLVAWTRRRELDLSWYDEKPRGREAPYLDALRRIAKETGTPLIDVHAVFEASGRQPAELFFDNSHASVVGCELVADAVARAIAALGEDGIAGGDK